MRNEARSGVELLVLFLQLFRALLPIRVLDDAGRRAAELALEFWRRAQDPQQQRFGQERLTAIPRVAHSCLIRPDAGDQVGHTMRRGLVVVGGRCGDLAGINMIAGTLLVFGAPGMRAGAGMRRGTIGLMTTPEPKLLPTFVRGGIDRPLFLQLLFRELRGLGFDVPNECWTSAYRMYHGDMAGVGRGEILAPAAG